MRETPRWTRYVYRDMLIEPGDHRRSDTGCKPDRVDDRFKAQDSSLDFDLDDYAQIVGFRWFYSDG